MDPNLVLTGGQKTLRFRKHLKKVAKLNKSCVKNKTTEALEDTGKYYNHPFEPIFQSTAGNEGVKNTEQLVISQIEIFKCKYISSNFRILIHY